MCSFKHTLEQAEDWIDGHGKWGWIGVTVLGFIVFWPIGLAILVYLFLRKTGLWKRIDGKDGEALAPGEGIFRKAKNTGNAAFDSYMEESYRRLESERDAFHKFVVDLEQARKQAGFDDFMAERKKADKKAETSAGSKKTKRKPTAG